MNVLLHAVMLYDVIQGILLPAGEYVDKSLDQDIVYVTVQIGIQ
jgi:hypothetical protein